MKITCNAQQLSSACLNVQRAVSSKAAIPALEGILIEAISGNCLQLTGYDLELGISTQIPAKVEVAGSIVLGAKLFCDIIKRLPSETVTIEIDDRQTATITSGFAEYSLIGIKADEYPELPSFEVDEPIVIKQNLLKDMVRKTIFAISTDDSRPAHKGIKFEISKNLIKLVAIDGYRLAMRIETITYIGEETSFVVPGKTLSEVIKLLNEENDDVEILIGKRHIIFTVDGYKIVSRLLDGEFLEYTTSIPQSTSTTVLVNTKNLSDSISRTSLIISDRLKSPLRCIFSDNSIKTSCITAVGKAVDQIYATVEGERVEIGFNNKYFLDALNAIDNDVVRLELNGSMSPMKILPIDGEEFLFLVLPVRTKSE